MDVFWLINFDYVGLGWGAGLGGVAVSCIYRGEAAMLCQ